MPHTLGHDTESQEHLERCNRRITERRGLDTDTFDGKVIFWRRMAPTLKKLEDENKLKAFNDKVAKLPTKPKKNLKLAEKLKQRTKVLAKTREKKRLNGKNLPPDKRIN